eukprot:scaffold26824_cov67-Phaeocystis_antarctica.AAC.1
MGPGDQRSAPSGAPPSFRPPLLEAVRGFGTVFGAPAEKLTDCAGRRPFQTRGATDGKARAREQGAGGHRKASTTKHPKPVAMHPRATMPRSTATTRPLAIYNPPAA